MMSLGKCRGGEARPVGFTFLEIMLVVMIIGILLAVVGPKIAGRGKKAKIAAARQQIAVFKTALGMYEMTVGDFPSTEQGLKALISRPSDVAEEDWEKSLDSEEVPKDPFHLDYVYHYPGDHGTDYDLISVGPDKREGTDDDITNFQREKGSN